MTPNTNPFLRAAGISGQENLESTPRLSAHLNAGIQNTATHASQQIFVSPNKKTVMRRTDAPKDEAVQGNVIVSAVFTRGFKVLYSLTQHTYTNGIDTMF